MACLDIDPGFRDVTTVPQLSTPYTPALCARTYKHSVHTHARVRARVNSGMLRSYVGRIHTHRKGSQGSRVYVCDCGLGTYSITGDLLGKVIPFSRLQTPYRAREFRRSVAIERTFRLSRVLARHKSLSRFSWCNRAKFVPSCRNLFFALYKCKLLIN